MHEHIDTIAQVLSGFDLSLKEYIIDNDSVLEKAKKYFDSHTNSMDEPSLEEIRRYLNCRFEDIINRKIEWQQLPEILKSEDIISFRYNSAMVQGIITVEPKNIDVTMITPFLGVEGGVQILASAPIIFTLEPFVGSPANCVGAECAKRVLVNLFINQASLDVTHFPE